MQTDKKLYVEKRKRLRTSFMAEVVVYSSQGRVINAYMVNISLKGMFVETDQFIKPGSSCNADIILKCPGSSLAISAKGFVARLSSSGFAIQFENDLEWWSLFTIFSSYGKPADNFIPASFFDELIAEAA